MGDRKALQFLFHTLMYGKNLKKNTEILILILAFFTVIFYTFLKLNDMHKSKNGYLYILYTDMNSEKTEKHLKKLS